LYREFHEKKENIHRVFEEIDYETGEILWKNLNLKWMSIKM
jgi:hypothetical protein